MGQGLVYYNKGEKLCTTKLERKSKAINAYESVQDLADYCVKRSPPNSKGLINPWLASICDDLDRLWNKKLPSESDNLLEYYLTLVERLQVHLLDYASRNGFKRAAENRRYNFKGVNYE